MNNRTLEIGVGLFVILGMLALLVLALQVSNLALFNKDTGYNVTARFTNIGGLKVRSPVSLAGVRVGRVSAIELDSQTLEAKVVITLNSKYDHIPSDSAASIFTAGLLGEQYVSLSNGVSEDEFLEEGSELYLTQPALVLEEVIGGFLYNQASEGALQGGSQ